MNDNIGNELASLHSKLLQSGFKFPENFCPTRTFTDCVENLIHTCDEPRCSSVLTLMEKAFDSVSLTCLNNGYLSALSCGDKLLAQACRYRSMAYYKNIKSRNASCPTSGSFVAKEQERKPSSIRFTFAESLLSKNIPNIKDCGRETIESNRSKPKGSNVQANVILTTSLLDLNNRVSSLPSDIKKDDRPNANSAALSVHQTMFRPIREGCSIPHVPFRDSKTLLRGNSADKKKKKPLISTESSNNDIKHVKNTCVKAAEKFSINLLKEKTTTRRSKNPYPANQLMVSKNKSGVAMPIISSESSSSIKKRNVENQLGSGKINNRRTIKSNSATKQLTTASVKNARRKRKNRSMDSGANSISPPTKRLRKTYVPIIKKAMSEQNVTGGSTLSRGSFKSKYDDITSADTSALTHLMTPTSTMSSRRGKMRIFRKRNLFGTSKGKK